MTFTANPQTRRQALYALEVMLYQADRNKVATNFGYKRDEGEAAREAEKIRERIAQIEEGE